MPGVGFWSAAFVLLSLSATHRLGILFARDSKPLPPRQLMLRQEKRRQRDLMHRTFVLNRCGGIVIGPGCVFTLRAHQEGPAWQQHEDDPRLAGHLRSYRPPALALHLCDSRSAETLRDPDAGSGTQGDRGPTCSFSTKLAVAIFAHAGCRARAWSQLSCWYAFTVLARID